MLKQLGIPGINFQECTIGHGVISLHYSSKTYIVLAFTYRSMIYFESLLVYHERSGSQNIPLHVDVQLS